MIIFILSIYSYIYYGGVISSMNLEFCTYKRMDLIYFSSRFRIIKVKAK